MSIPRIVNLLGNMDNDLISNAATYTGNYKIRYRKYYKIAAVACLVFMLVIPTMITLKKQGSITDNEYKDFYESIQEITWADTDNMGEKFVTVMFEGIEYTTTGKCLATDYVNEFLGEIDVTGYDEKDVEYCMRAKVFSIKKISDECGIVLKFPDVGGYYIYTNSSYQPEKMQEFIDDLNLYSTLRIYSFFHDNIYYKGCDADGILSLLNMEPATSINIEKEELLNCKEVMVLSVSIPEIGCVNQGIVLYEEGYISTNILSARKTYWVGEKKIEEVVNYVVKKCEQMKGTEFLQNGIETE